MWWKFKYFIGRKTGCKLNNQTEFGDRDVGNKESDNFLNWGIHAYKKGEIFMNHLI